MKIFITGATGFIGGNLIKKLIDEGQDITINLRNGNIHSFGDKVKTYTLDVNNIEKDIEYFQKNNFDGVIHLASLYLANHKPQDVNALINSNVGFSCHVLECAVLSKTKWFINTGTFWQSYKNCTYLPVNLYAATKQAFEDIAKYYVDSELIKFVTIRLSDTYGPNDPRPKVFSLWNRIAETGEVLDMSAGDQLIDICYIEDVTDAFIKLAVLIQDCNNEITNGVSFAVLAEKRYTLKELATVYESVTNKTLKINWGSRPYRQREVMVPWENGIPVPGWKPRIGITEGIKLLNT